MANDPLMSQDEIERLFSQPKDAAAPAKAAAAPPARPAPAKADEGPMSQDDIEKLLAAAAQSAPPPPPPPPAQTQAAPAVARPTVAAAPSEPDIMPQDIDYLLAQAERALESVNATAPGDLPPGVSSYRLEELGGSPASTEAATLDLIRDVELDLRIELGRTHMYLEDVLRLRKGSVVPLDKLAGDPVDIYVNGRLVARGEVLVLNDNFCVRVAELIVGTQMIA
jgi:flagellar motor switch protein FliN/FliY